MDEHSNKDYGERIEEGFLEDDGNISRKHGRDDTDNLGLIPKAKKITSM